MSGPEVVAHRGATAEAPEHTLAAYRHAVDIGADAVECDVRMTRDGVLVCVHDRKVHRTSNGRGVVSTLRLAELEALQFRARRGRFSRWKDDEILAVADEPDVENGQVLTLERLLDLPIVGDVRGEGYFYGIELVKDKTTRETFDAAESESMLRGYLSKALFDAGLYCRADDRGDPVIQLAPPLICGQAEFDLMEQVLRGVLTEAWARL